ncbi:MAG: hypothetical protein OXI72_22940 [Gemmatimonadota bacterium]|nr:hypothetical protein [Gemmatimonadota bacterium]
MQRLIDYSTRFPFVDLEGLLSHPKAKKPSDLHRILKSPQSEDWVTWNVLQAIQRREPASWWPELVSLAKSHASALDDSLAYSSPPTIDLWRTVPTPCEYERASRLRMESSDKAEWRKRAQNSKPVEGPTEVDAVLKGDDYLIFVEAKLGSDVSEQTTYDPLRNQIVRNIDCAIEHAGDRRPYFWMFVKDRRPKYRYSVIIDRYRSDPRTLETEMPHRNPEVLACIVRGIAMVEWRELSPLLPDTSELSDVLAELRQRVD